MYKYENERPTLFTENGMNVVIKVRDEARRLLSISGCFMLGHLMSKVTGDSWTTMAAVDYLCERGEMKEVVQSISVMSQHKIYKETN